MVNISSLHPRCTDMISILHSIGSKGNSAICKKHVSRYSVKNLESSQCKKKKKSKALSYTFTLQRGVLDPEILYSIWSKLFVCIHYHKNIPITHQKTTRQWQQKETNNAKQGLPWLLSCHPLSIGSPGRGKRKFYFAYPAPKSSEQPLIIQSSQGVELLHGSYESFHGGSIHKVKGQQIIDAHSLEGLEKSQVKTLRRKTTNSSQRYNGKQWDTTKLYASPASCSYPVCMCSHKHRAAFLYMK